MNIDFILSPLIFLHDLAVRRTHLYNKNNPQRYTFLALLDEIIPSAQYHLPQKLIDVIVGAAVFELEKIPPLQIQDQSAVSWIVYC